MPRHRQPMTRETEAWLTFVGTLVAVFLIMLVVSFL